jgi:hypothetical protein
LSHCIQLVTSVSSLIHSFLYCSFAPNVQAEHAALTAKIEALEAQQLQVPLESEKSSTDPRESEEIAELKAERDSLVAKMNVMETE